MSPNASTTFEPATKERPTTSASLLHELYAPIQDDLLAAQRVFDDELTSDLPFVNDMCATVRSYRGKMLRPALLLLCGKAAGKVTAEHHVAAAVVEMVHMATLVHDDVLDAAQERRKRPTIAATEGNTAAVLLGDYLISHAFHLCSSLPSTHASRRIGAITNVVCEGELMQNRCAGDLGLSERDYTEIVRRKTGVLTAVSCELGAYFAEADAATVHSMYEFGEQAGIAFQIMDDVLDLTGDAGLVGKTLGRDLAQGKLTLPLIHAIEHADALTRRAIRDALGGAREMSPSHLVDKLTTCGSIEYTVGCARRHVDRALAHLESLSDGESGRCLTKLAEFIIARSF